MKRFFIHLILILLIISCGDTYGTYQEKCYPDGTCDSGFECNTSKNRCETIKTCADTCNGCCNGMMCVDEITDSQCGLWGEQCKSCGSDEFCSLGICVSEDEKPDCITAFRCYLACESQGCADKCAENVHTDSVSAFEDLYNCSKSNCSNTSSNEGYDACLQDNCETEMTRCLKS